MAEETAHVKTGRLKRFDRALRGKANKYTWSGLIITACGLLVLFIRMSFATSYPLNMLLIGLAALLVIIGVIRLLIGFINPATPQDIIPITDSEHSLQQDTLPTVDSGSE